jgi:DNA-binding beta-propeller fold protein YncE
LGPDGSIYFASTQDGSTIRRVRVRRPTGLVHAFAGTGVWPAGAPLDPQGSAASAIKLNARDIAVSPDGSKVYIVNEFDNVDEPEIAVVEDSTITPLIGRAADWVTGEAGAPIPNTSPTLEGCKELEGSALYAACNNVDPLDLPLGQHAKLDVADNGDLYIQHMAVYRYNGSTIEMVSGFCSNDIYAASGDDSMYSHFSNSYQQGGVALLPDGRILVGDRGRAMLMMLEGY